MNNLMFGIRGQPVPKQSFRVAPGGGGYTEARVKAWQDTVQLSAQLARNDQCPEWKLDQAYTVVLHFLLGDYRNRDLDNLSKPVLDGMNNVIWDDDKQVENLVLLKNRVSKDLAGVFIIVQTIQPSSLNIWDVKAKWDRTPTYAE